VACTANRAAARSFRALGAIFEFGVLLGRLLVLLPELGRSIAARLPKQKPRRGSTTAG
jgi:hypothetical protein